MNWHYKPYVPVSQRRANALKEIQALRKKGMLIEPIEAFRGRGSKVASSFWGCAWCDHLESFSDLANRLPRGRTYVRNGSVMHLGIGSGKIDTIVMGSELYRQTIRIDPLPAAKWQALKRRCQGKIGSLIELLQGRISGEIMSLVADREEGLFPSPAEIHLDCDCPDYADLCKHLAAVLYGVGVRLDSAPELLFKLRGVDHSELIQADAATLPGTGSPSSRRRTLDASALGNVFGIELDDEAEPSTAINREPEPKAKQPAAPVKKSAPARKRASKQPTAPKPPARSKCAAKTRPPFQATPAAIRALRERHGLSRTAFAARLGVSVQSVKNWETATGKLRLQPRSMSGLRRLHRADHD